MAQAVKCPVDFVPINENKVRITAGFVTLISAAFLIVNHWSIAFFLVIDFFTRALLNPKYSLLGILSDAIVKTFSIKYKPTDRGAKRFAALIGFVICDIILITTVFQLDIVAQIGACIIIFFALLESIFSFCAGCYVYTFLKNVSLFKASSEKINTIIS